MKPPSLASESIATAESVSIFRRQRWNPLRYISPQSLARMLDAFEFGNLGEFCFLGETVAERDETIKAVKSKREKSAAARPWTIQLRNETPEAHRHREILNGFWSRVRTENAYDRNVRGGMGRLIKQMMTAVSYRYAVHHIVWKPTGRFQLDATFEFVPLFFFKNTTGRLRFIKDGSAGNAGDGEALADDEWMVTTGDGLMVSGLVAYVAKRFALQDWLAFSEKFSMPGIIGATAGAKNSPEGEAMKAAVQGFGQDWSAVLYGVSDPAKPPLHLIQPEGNPAAMPMPELVERFDRRLATLWCGADLSTMSSKSGSGTGASVQGGQMGILAADDCTSISESFREVEKTVIAWHCGEGTEPLAHFQLTPPDESDKREQLALIQSLAAAGVRIGQADAAARLGLPLAAGDEAAFGKARGKIS